MSFLFGGIETYRQAFLDNSLGGRMWVDSTIYLYVGMIVLVIFSGLFAEHSCKKTGAFWFVIAAAILSAILGFRGENVGADTWQYIDTFNHAWESGYWADSTSEPGYHLLMRALRVILPNSTVFLVVISILTVYFVFNTLWKNRKSINLLIAFSFYVGLFFFQALNLLRIYLAAAFVLWNYHYLIDRQYGKFALVVLLTSLIHFSTAVMLLPLGFLCLYQKNPKIALMAVAALVAVAIPLTSQFGDIIQIARYAAYGDSNDSSRSVGIMLFFDYLPPFFFVYYALRNKIKGQWTDVLVSLTVTGFVIRLLAYFITIAGRLSVHYIGLFVLVIPYFVEHMKRHHHRLYGLTMVALMVYLVVRIHFYFIGYLATDGIMPYNFIWNE